MNMTGKYSDFKGKLKVGDRVRHNHQSWNAEAEVLEVDEEWFRTTEGCFLWTWDTGTLELLSPPPRVVTLETLEPGDEVTDGKMLMQVLDVSKNGAIHFMSCRYLKGMDKSQKLICGYSLADLKEQEWQPVQPASPPAPAEKGEEWWVKLWKESHRAYDVELVEDVLGLIVAEAKRRGAEEAWKECRFLIAHTKLWSKGNVEGTRQDILARVDAKFESLNKPAGGGEK